MLRSRKDSHEEKEVQESDHKAMYELLCPSLSCTCMDLTLNSTQEALRTDLQVDHYPSLTLRSGVNVHGTDPGSRAKTLETELTLESQPAEGRIGNCNQT